MTKKEAIKILDTMADGNHPKTGSPLPVQSICNEREVIRALQVAIDALRLQIKNTESHEKSDEKLQPSNVVKKTTSSFYSQDILNKFFTEEKIFNYLKEFKDAEFNPTISRLGKALIGSKAKSIYDKVCSFFCYGILEGKTTYNTIKPLLTDFFEKYDDIIKREYTINDSPWEELDFFDQDIFNTFTKTNKRKFIESIEVLPFKRLNEEINSEQIILARQLYPRAYEPWTQTENELLLNALRYSNDLTILSDIFQRGEVGIKLQGLKLLYHIEKEMVKRRIPMGK